MRNRFALPAVLAALVMAFAATHVYAQAREQGRLLMATEVLEEIRASRDQFIPERLLERAYGIVVVPSVTKVAFIAGGRWGKGVMVVRDRNGNFTNPVFVNLAGASFGWQWGGQSTDIVLVFTTQAGVEGITDGKLTLGADASVAAGPVGRSASAATDQNFAAEVYSYSRSRGLFAGIALDGTSLSVDSRANAAYYRKRGVKASDIVSGAVTTSDDTARRFLAAVATSTTGTAPAAAGTAAPSTTGSSGSTSLAEGPGSTTRPSSEARTFPMEDPEPGREPH